MRHCFPLFGSLISMLYIEHTNDYVQTTNECTNSLGIFTTRSIKTTASTAMSKKIQSCNSKAKSKSKEKPLLYMKYEMFRP